ncbi:hypothetical protein BJ170DRAFT_618517 [Xylariales sp. AK1849]|nr:hypothetical protein BJ170DRAFT_618517 [Xylariales sp. AK1849]
MSLLLWHLFLSFVTVVLCPSLIWSFAQSFSLSIQNLNSIRLTYNGSSGYSESLRCSGNGRVLPRQYVTFLLLEDATARFDYRSMALSYQRMTRKRPRVTRRSRS